MGELIVLEGVTKRYGAGPGASVALDGLDLTVPAQQFLSVMGASGSGKSTLLNLIAGLETPTSGRVILAERDMAQLSDDARTDFRLRRLGVVFQGFNLLPTYSVEENVLWPLELLGVARRPARDRTRAALTQVGLPDTTYARRPAELSGGEQQRVAIARAIVTEPEIVLADEPTGNLDSRTGQALLDLLRRLNHERRVTVVMVTHNTLAATYGDRTVELRDGRVVRDVQAPPEPTGRVVPLRP
jgi:putative ABC transport system ATP-binding protein